VGSLTLFERSIGKAPSKEAGKRRRQNEEKKYRHDKTLF